jgi:cell division protein FtsI (penicillin-binding protein 3)
LIIRKKILLTIFIFAGLFLSLIGRAFYLQVYNKEKLIKYADTQFIRATKLYPQRGQILDRDLVPLAVNIQKFDLYAMPQEMKSYRQIFQVCKVVSNINCQDLYKKISSRKKFTWITREAKLNDRQLKLLKNIDGVYVDDRFSRYYPHRQMAAALVGHVNVDLEGTAGIEYSFDHELKGAPKNIRYYKDAKGRPVKMDSFQFHGKGQDIVLSIDHELQAMTEKYLAEGVREVNANAGGAIVMNAETGEILAMANVPSFDPNNYGDYSPKERKLSLLTDPFEPGSTFKIFTVAAALEEKVVTPESKYFCENGKMQIGKRTIGEAAGHKYGWLSVSDIFKHSSNIGTTKIAMELGYAKLHRFIEKLNFGKPTGIEIKGESKGIYKEIKKPSLIHLSNLSFGQGIATTPLQMVAAYSAIVNDGVMIKPTILRVDDKSKIDKKRVMRLDTATKLQKMLIHVVDNGTGYNAKISQFDIAGKTSTAQKVGADGKYSGIIAGFIGFPLNVDQKLVVYVYVDEPKDKKYGNDVAAPIFQKIMSYYLYQSKDVSPTRLAQNEMITDAVNKQQAALVRTKDIGTVPNFIGLDKITALELAAVNNIEIEIKGSGIVEKQSPEAFTVLKPKSKVVLNFSYSEY